MKKIFLLLMVFTLGTVYAQNSNEVSVKRVVDLFYDGFNERDSVKIKRALAENVSYQVVEELFGNNVLKDEELSEVIHAIISIPKTTKFQLKTSKVVINAGDQIANVWTESQFFLFGTYYQCGSSSIQLVKINNDWRITSILDNYSREACKDQ